MNAVTLAGWFMGWLCLFITSYGEDGMCWRTQQICSRHVYVGRRSRRVQDKFGGSCPSKSHSYVPGRSPRRPTGFRDLLLREGKGRVIVRKAIGWDKTVVNICLLLLNTCNSLNAHEPRIKWWILVHQTVSHNYQPGLWSDWFLYNCTECTTILITVFTYTVFQLHCG